MRDTRYAVAVVGAGPAGFFAAERLLQNLKDSVSIDLFESLPRPFGLVEYGVAPDHDRLKFAMKTQMRRVLENASVRFFGNIRIGKDLSVSQLRRAYDAVLITTGQQSTKSLGIPGEDLKGVYAGKDLVSYSNESPDHPQWDFRIGERVAVIGNGNVAMDVTRFLVKGRSRVMGERGQLQREATQELEQVREIFMVGRRGPFQAKFTFHELQELGSLGEAGLWIESRYLDPDPLAERAIEKDGLRNVAYLRALKPHPEKAIQIRLEFFLAPLAFLGEGGHLRAIRFEKNIFRDEEGKMVLQQTGETLTLPMDAVFITIGDFGFPIEGLPFDARLGVIPSKDYSVLKDGIPLPDVYVGGWIRTGPRGVLGVTKQEAIQLAEQVSRDLLKKPPKMNKGDILSYLKECGLSYVSYADFQRLEAEETRRGQAQGLERAKISSIPEMIQVIGSLRG